VIMVGGKGRGIGEKGRRERRKIVENMEKWRNRVKGVMRVMIGITGY